MVYRVSAAVAVLVLAGCYAEPTPVRKVPDPVPQCALPRPVAQRTYMVIFDQHSDVIPDRGARILREFVNFLRPFGDLKIVVLASTDASEILVPDHGLDVRRGRAVARMIRDIGVPRDSSIDVEGYGNSRPLVATPPGVAEPLNRNVTLIVSMARQMMPFPYQAACMRWLQTHDCGADADEAQLSVCRKVQDVARQFIRH